MSGLLCVGDLNLDITVTIRDRLAIGSDTAGTVELHGGGSAANVAVWAARSGAAVRFIGVIGDDATGTFLVEELGAHGVDVNVIRRGSTRTRSIAAIVDADGERSLVSDLDSLLYPSIDDFDPEWLDRTDWMHLTGYTYIAEHSRGLFAHITAEARRRGIRYSIDPSAAQLLRSNCNRDAVIDAFTGASVLFPNHDEATYLSGRHDPFEAAETLLEIAAVVVVTLGARGVAIASRGEPVIEVPAPSIEIVNTLGAGDAFAAGFLAARLRGVALRDAAENGIRSATAAIGQVAAR